MAHGQERSRRARLAFAWLRLGREPVECVGACQTLARKTAPTALQRGRTCTNAMAPAYVPRSSVGYGWAGVRHTGIAPPCRPPTPAHPDRRRTRSCRVVQETPEPKHWRRPPGGRAPQWGDYRGAPAPCCFNLGSASPVLHRRRVRSPEPKVRASQRQAPRPPARAAGVF